MIDPMQPGVYDPEPSEAWAQAIEEGIREGIARRKARQEQENISSGSFTLSGNVIKVDEDKRLVFGWFSIVEVAGKPVVDTQDDVIAPAVMEDSVYEFVLHARKAGEMHRTGKNDEITGVGRLVESVIFTKEKQRVMRESLKDQGIDAVLDLGCIAWWGGFKVDNIETWKKVVGGELKAFSLGGSGKHAVV